MEYLDGVPVVEVRKKVEANAQSAGMQDPLAGRSAFTPASDAVVAGGGAVGAMATTGDKQATGASRKARGAKVKDEAPPSLKMLLQNLELANEDPARAMEHLKALSDDVDVLVAKVHMLDQHFAPDQDEAEMEFHIETFM